MTRATRYLGAGSKLQSAVGNFAFVSHQADGPAAYRLGGAAGGAAGR